MSSESHAVTPAAPASAPARRAPALTAPLGAAAVCLVAFAAVWLVAELIPAVHRRDAVALDQIIKSRPQGLVHPARTLIRAFGPLPAVLWTGALACIALARGRPRTALAVVGLVALAELTAQVLKPLLAHSQVHVGAATVQGGSWPSGHTTAATALALGAVLVASPRLRPLVIVAALALCAAVGWALLMLDMHMPSDVLGGYLLALFFTAVAVAALRRPAPTAARPRRRRAR